MRFNETVVIDTTTHYPLSSVLGVVDPIDDIIWRIGTNVLNVNCNHVEIVLVKSFNHHLI